jgi:hypothetical protein
VQKDIRMAKGHEDQFAEVGMGSEVLQGMQLIAFVSRPLSVENCGQNIQRFREVDKPRIHPLSFLGRGAGVQNVCTVPVGA